jgi:prepilin-type N-terminal cleavage/methylation domain-containing protein
MRASTAFRRGSIQGFTLIEMLVVIAVIAVLAGVLLPVLTQAKAKARIAVAKAEMRTLQLAIYSYKSAYGVWPGSTMVYQSAAQNVDCNDFTYGTTWPNGALLKTGYPTIVSYYNSTSPSYQTCNAELVALLKSSNTVATPQLQALSAAGNPQGMDLLTVRSARAEGSPGLGPDGVFRDPWGNPYIITLDLDYNESCIDGFYGQLRKRSGLSAAIKADILIWSFGPDGKVNPNSVIGVNGGENKDNIVSW